ncbi:uncharacterized protein [Diabrotica undecimpunctata]|uniref:uncharacterized protein n=1 Tax=Diabrotica undecimpunctata TaxID=50387 RepID=UPI003B63B84E
MATIYELTVTNLRRHLEDRELASTGKKAELVQRLKNALQEEGLDPETYIFEDAVLSSISKVSGDIASLENKVSGDISKVSGDIASLENKVSNEISSANISKVTSEMSALDDRVSSLKNQVAADMLAFEEKIWKEMEKKLEETGTAERGNNPITAETKEDETKCKLEIRPKFEGSGGSVHVKVPTFDGKSSWNNYMKQFESAARANGWSEKEKAVNLTIALRGDALDVLQTIAVEETDDFEQLKKRLNMRYGHEHLEHVYQSQLKNRRQKKDEALQEYEVDIARLVRYAYPTAPEDMMEKLAVQTFIDGLRDHEMQRTLRLARHKTLVDVLSAALEYESATQASGGYSKVRTVKEEGDEDKLDQLVNMMKSMTYKKTKTIKSRNSPSGKPERVGFRGAASTRNFSKDPLILIASLTCREDSVYVDGEINGKKHTLLVDTGATRTIIRPTIINSRKKLLPTRLRLRTAIGENANIHGEIQVQLGIGAEKFVNTVIVADIEEDIILGMDVMNMHGFQLDFKNKVIKVGNEEVFLHPHNDNTVQAAINEDTVVPARSETIIVARLQGIVDEGTPVMMEPWNHDDEIVRENSTSWQKENRSDDDLLV